ncbi:MAG: ABC transporter permease, partial [Mycobacterium leprae]
MKRYLSIYRLFLFQRLKVLMEYRVNFFIGMSSTIVLQGASILTLWVVMGRIPNLNGWTLSEILLIYGLVSLAMSIPHMFADNLWTLGRAYIQPGGFDRFLVRPLDPLFHLLADRFCQDGIGDFIVGVVLVAVAGRGAGVHWTPLNLLVLVLAVLAGATVFFSINLLLGTSAFWVMDSVPIILAVQQTNQFARYPLSIYNKAISVV